MTEADLKRALSVAASAINSYRWTIRQLLDDKDSVIHPAMRSGAESTLVSGLNGDVVEFMKAPGTNFQKTSEWLRRAGKVPGDAKALSTQIACHIEEFLEFLDALNIDDPDMTLELAEAMRGLDFVSSDLKRGGCVATIHNREACLDALCDTDVTGNGVAYLAGFDKDGADAEVHRSNFSKFNEDGSPVILPGGKIGKSALYTPPNLEPYL